ncbi:respiratory chain complex I subunit 1 family protein [Allochromatium vinosum]|uniref:Respiratory-chain NADH dehydrogenase subunit 1 n=1 Tax=Allochromatium vinosum (strain ATCC 17899 / DSM 180 / NBRC 103801 / NCIMB 10441 / D) TaxID=572477 RepID=D3RN15_ALLVD|nr:complex I subunit 1 family protein [Allochromatium vinosum]ADC61299.1 respiratory-chain NADH dehydrogenase subunit 1 [Allochromatium vinosum DSM 180]
MNTHYAWWLAIAFVVLGPVVGALLAGIDRRLTARMQSRQGPPILQPVYDVLKLFEKDTLVVTRLQTLYLWFFLFFMVISGFILFLGSDLLLSLFALTVSGIFLCLAAYSTNSPYSNIGSSRELMLMMAYEPMLILVPLGFYLTTDSFRVADIVAGSPWQVLQLSGILVGFLFVLTIKLRKSPFDLSTSHHGHQELVKGLTTDFSGSDLALVEIAHWYENVILLGWLYLFFAPWGPWLALPIAFALFFVEVLVDNTHARLTWSSTLKATWWVTLLAGVTNLMLLPLVV